MLELGELGDEIIFTDYARTWGTNALTINSNSLNFQGNASLNPVYDTAGESIHIVYQDVTKGWIPIFDGAVTLYVPTIDTEYLIVAGGGSSGRDSAIDGNSPGAGAGGYRTNYGGTAISLVSGTTYTVTVGEGGAVYGPAAGEGAVGNKGENSSFSGSGLTTITATGGGFSTGGNTAGPFPDSGDGGSGGGGGNGGTSGSAGSGNEGGDGGSPSIPEGFDGGAGAPAANMGGGGGAAEAGGTDSAYEGGDGLSNSITGSAVVYAGGGGGSGGAANHAGGTGGGGAGADYNTNAGTPGTDGLGGGGGGVANGTLGSDPRVGTTGGDGVVILRVATADKGTPSGEDSSAVDGADTVITWLSDGSYVA